MKPALFNVLCEIKEKTGREATPLVPRCFSFCSLKVLFRKVCDPPSCPNPCVGVFKWGETTPWYAVLLALGSSDVVCVCRGEQRGLVPIVELLLIYCFLGGEEGKMENGAVSLLLWVFFFPP